MLQSTMYTPDDSSVNRATKVLNLKKRMVDLLHKIREMREDRQTCTTNQKLAVAKPCDDIISMYRILCLFADLL